MPLLQRVDYYFERTRNLATSLYTITSDFFIITSDFSLFHYSIDTGSMNISLHPISIVDEFVLSFHCLPYYSLSKLMKAFFVQKLDMLWTITGTIYKCYAGYSPDYDCQQL